MFDNLTSVGFPYPVSASFFLRQAAEWELTLSLKWVSEIPLPGADAVAAILYVSIEKVVQGIRSRDFGSTWNECRRYRDDERVQGLNTKRITKNKF